MPVAKYYCPQFIPSDLEMKIIKKEIENIKAPTIKKRFIINDKLHKKLCNQDHKIDTSFY